MNGLEGRVTWLEQKQPGHNDPFARFSDENLEEMIETINEVLVARVEAGDERVEALPPGEWDAAFAFVTARRAERGRLSADELGARAARFDAMSAGLIDHVDLLPYVSRGGTP